MSKSLTAIIQTEPPGFVALCPELDVASQGDTIEESLANLREVVELFHECASPAEISARDGDENLKSLPASPAWSVKLEVAKLAFLRENRPFAANRWPS